ncbi:MAG TPA: site-specific DNA-methyltransferase, partial [Accumulibacter sp.]|nr:site-specific DNA-methyltransferase [Accumulibacter sp.]
PEYCRMAARYLKAENTDLFTTASLSFERVASADVASESAPRLREDHALYEIRPARKKLA